MNCSMHAAFAAWRFGAVMAVAWVSVGAQPPDPADPGSAAARLETPSVLPPGAGGYLGRVDQPGLPWPSLYEPDGSFVPESAFGDSNAPAPAMASKKPAMVTSPQGGDSRGVVRRVDKARGRVTIKHGPIEKLDMPGMTMTFRARDPALLEGLEPGDEVNFDVTVESSRFFITRIRK
jgi:Cu/Ag efflux protein CusF